MIADQPPFLGTCMSLPANPSSIPTLAGAPSPSPGSTQASGGASPPPTPPQTTVVCVPPNPPAKDDGLFSALKDVLPVLAIYSFFSGWVYSYAFFKSFRVPVPSLDMPLQHFFIYSFSVFATWKGGILILLTAVSVAIFKKHKLTMVLIACLLFPIIFGIAFIQGTQDASLQRYSSTNDRIVFGFKEEAGKRLPVDLKFNNDSERLRLLTETKDRVFVFYQPPAYAQGQLPPVLVYDVAKSDLTSITRQVNDKRKLSLPEILWSFIHEQSAK